MTSGLSRRRFIEIAGRAGTALLAMPGLAWAQERALAIHEATHNTLLGAVGVRLRQLFGGRPQPYKCYPGAERTRLPEAESGPARSLVSALDARRSERPMERPMAGPGQAEPKDEPRVGTDLETNPTEGSITLARLTRVLEAANGVTGRGPGGIRLRAAPSAGALYAGELYVVAESVEGLATGLYYYSPLSRELVLLREGSHRSTVAAALEAPARTAGVAAVVLVTSVFPRYRWRYANRGYRYGLIDVGHVSENLRLATTSAGMAVSSQRRFHDDRLNTLLDIDGLDEAACAVHLLGGPEGSASKAPRTRDLVEATAAGLGLPPAADDPPDHYHARTKLVPAAAAVAGSAEPGRREGESGAKDASESERDDGGSPGERERESVEGGSVMTLAPREDPGAAVEQLIRHRRSARRFAPDPIARADLAFVLDAALGREEGKEAHLELLVFIHRGVDLESGLHRVRRGATGAPELVREQAGDLSDRLVEACLGQEKAGAAAAAIAMVGAIESAAETGGDRSYRDLCLGAGAVGQRIYLAAESVGIAARNLSAFVDERLNALSGLDGRRKAVLHLTMLGPGD